MINNTFTVNFEPIGKRVHTDGEDSLLALAQANGISLSAVCGGSGVCGACKVICINGALSDLTENEREAFTEIDLAGGWRLACLAYPRGDVTIDIPPESMTTTQRLQVDGALREITPDPIVSTKNFTLSPPTLDDLQTDWERFTTELGIVDKGAQTTPLPVLAQFSSMMRSNGWAGAVIFSQNKHVVGFLSQNQSCYGVAVDIGTTKMAAFLVNLETGKTVAKKGVINPQIRYGEDVVSRIAYANQGENHRKVLQTCLVEEINELIAGLCSEVACEPTQVADFVVVGNTAIHHFFTGLPVTQLGEAPYVAAVQQALLFPAREISLIGAPGGMVYMPPNIAGYVGADHVAMLLSSEVDQRDNVVVALDIGTNTEISLFKQGRLVCCSCASGPAFEGAHILAGMRAAPGGIERARFLGSGWQVATIDNLPPVGLCGSGILDVVAELVASQQVDLTGRFTQLAKNRVTAEKGGAIVLVPAHDSGTGKDILVSRADIREIQLAKAAIRAGINALLQATSTQQDQIERFIVAGAFGTYLNLDSAIRIGMFPALPRERFLQVGNAAGVGAQQMLVSQACRSKAEVIGKKVDYIELTTDPGFMESYVDAIGFEDGRKD